MAFVGSAVYAWQSLVRTQQSASQVTVAHEQEFYLAFLATMKII
jgi:hypothetical protein